MKKKTFDPREALADKLNKAGIDAHTAFLIALDAGRNLVDKDYLIDLHLRDKQLIVAESLVKDFYWGDYNSPLKTGGLGGASTSTGLSLEGKVNFQQLIGAIPGYSVKKVPGKAGMGIFFEGELVARCFKKYDFYDFLSEEKVDWSQVLSKELLPYDALLVIVREILFIIEVKHQQVAEYVYRKLQTCDFKRKQYLKLVAPLGLKVEYVYVLSDWFKSQNTRMCWIT
jgi:hypothetical protein